MRFRVGTDVGGTFTDPVSDPRRRRKAAVKSPTTAGIIGGVRRAVELAA